LRVLITGDSHCLAYADAGDSLTPGITFDVRMAGPSSSFHTPFHTDFGSHIAFRHEVFYIEDFARRLPHFPLAHQGRPFDWYGFSGPLHLTDLWLDEVLFADGRLAISRSVLRQTVLDRTKSWLDFLEATKRLALRPFVLEPPGLFAASPLMNVFRRHVDDEELLALDSFARSVVREELDRIDVPVVDIPADAFGADGFMAEGLRHANPADPHHGNDVFATTMLARAADLIAKAGPGKVVPLPPHLLQSESADQAAHNVPVSRFSSPETEGERWVIQPGASSSIDQPSSLKIQAAGSVEGLAGLRIDHGRQAAPASDKTGGVSIALPGLSPLLAGKRITVSVLARSAEQARDTRFAVAVSIPGIATSGWRWFWASHQLLGQSFHYDVPVAEARDVIFLGLNPNDGSAQVTAAAEIFAVLIEAESLHEHRGG
jgi:hypothetical protein